MGLFFPSDPVIHGQRATGLPRYQELLERDWKSFLFADFVTLGLCIPYGLGVGYALLSSSLLVLIPVCVVGGLLVGPAISCMMDALFRSYRDAPRGWWENYCKGMKQNWKASLLPGVVFSLALDIELFSAWCCSPGSVCPVSEPWLFFWQVCLFCSCCLLRSGRRWYCLKKATFTACKMPCYSA